MKTTANIPQASSNDTPLGKQIMLHDPNAAPEQNTKLYDASVLAQVRFARVATFEDMMALGTPLVVTIFKVVSDVNAEGATVVYIWDSTDDTPIQLLGSNHF